MLKKTGGGHGLDKSRRIYNICFLDMETTDPTCGNTEDGGVQEDPGVVA